MADEHPENMLKVLEEIRDLLRDQNKLSMQASEEGRTRAIAQRRRLLALSTFVILMAVGLLFYLFFVIPASEQTFQRRMDQIQSNYLSQPH